MKTARAAAVIGISMIMVMGCATEHGVRAAGPASYFYGKAVADNHVRQAVSKGELMEVKYENGSVKAGFNLLNLDGWKAMGFWEKLGYVGTVGIDSFIGYTGYDKIKDEIKDRDNKDEPKITYANDRDTLSANNTGVGAIDVTYEVQPGGARPNNVYVANSSGGSVSVTVRELPPPEN